MTSLRGSSVQMVLGGCESENASVAEFKLSELRAKGSSAAYVLLLPSYCFRPSVVRIYTLL